MPTLSKYCARCHKNRQNHVLVRKPVTQASDPGMREAELVLQPKVVPRQRDDDPGPARGAFERRIHVRQPVRQRLVHGADGVPLDLLVEPLVPMAHDRRAPHGGLCGLRFPGHSCEVGAKFGLAFSLFQLLVLVLVLKLEF
ncbi:uncharacterized protein PG986_011781 [Apiospora aurea]|uniref:Uncharacterized protein n=1 Tax=Apiospora aurea TaxID=335848 RepID=A0ABR1PY66_9PEZI